MKNTEGRKPKWIFTKEPNLVKNVQSGRYYARFKTAGKQKWVSLDTDEWSVALIRIADERPKVARSRMAAEHVASGVATMGEIAKIYLGQIASATISETTKQRYAEHVAAVEKTWPGFARLRPDRVTRAAVLAWRDRLAREGTGWVVPGAKGTSKMCDGKSPGSINKLIDVIRRMIEIAVQQGQLHASPLSGRGVKLKSAPRKPHLPEPAAIEAIFAKIESRGLGRPLNCAELCRGLAYTGMRKNEAAALTWADLDFERGIIRVHGTKTESADREVPMIAAARGLFEKIRERRLATLHELEGEGAKLDPKSRVFQVHEAAKALTRACSETGVERLTHHDLRDAFATKCIESGVDIPTVAAWLGHKDGGALLMRVYAHHRRAHSLAQAAKVT